MPDAKYVLKKNDGGQFTFNLQAANGQVILSSQRYSSKASAENGIASVKTNASLDERYERKKSSDDQHYFVLVASNKEVIGRSEMYKATSGMENGISSVKTNGPKAAVDDRT